MKRLILLSALALGACTAQQAQVVNTASGNIAAMCNEAAPLVPLAGPVAPYIMGTCTAAGIVKVASDPAGQAWFADVIVKAKAFIHK